MRLICPNCSAQYEIDASLVPDEGRDVQCSNCGHTWFELPPPADFAETGTDTQDLATSAPEPEGEAFEPEADEIEDLTPSHAALAIAAASEESEDDEEDEPPAAPPGMKPGQRRPADAAALDILKEEAAREMSQRRAPPAEVFETQSELGLDVLRDRKTASRALRARMANQKESRPTEAPVSEPFPEEPPSRPEIVSKSPVEPARRDLLPDIDEINSTLSGTKKKPKKDLDQDIRRKGFRRGFLTMTLLAAAMILVYAQAPAIARMLPGSESALIPYVDGANMVRDWIDGVLGADA